MAHRRRTAEEPCGLCFGCGHLCTVCDFPVNACDCNLDTEALAPCSDCDATGVLQPDPVPLGKDVPRA